MSYLTNTWKGHAYDGLLSCLANGGYTPSSTYIWGFLLVPTYSFDPTDSYTTIHNKMLSATSTGLSTYTLQGGVQGSGYGYVTNSSGPIIYGTVSVPTGFTGTFKYAVLLRQSDNLPLMCFEYSSTYNQSTQGTWTLPCGSNDLMYWQKG